MIKRAFTFKKLDNKFIIIFSLLQFSQAAGRCINVWEAIKLAYPSTNKVVLINFYNLLGQKSVQRVLKSFSRIRDLYSPAGSSLNYHHSYYWASQINFAHLVASVIKV